MCIQSLISESQLKVTITSNDPTLVLIGMQFQQHTKNPTNRISTNVQHFHFDNELSCGHEEKGAHVLIM